jgi:transcriptional regulator with GAF, ATPase, and Fis domain
MFEVPSRATLKTLTTAVEAVGPTTAVGFVRQGQNDRVSVLYSYAHGIGGFLLPATGLPDVLVPTGDEHREADRATLESHRTRAAEQFLLDNQTERVVSIRLAGIEPPARLWVGLASPDPLTSEQLGRVDALTADGVRLLSEGLSQEEQFHQLRRLEQAAELIPALLHVLDVREVIERLSTTAKLALPHDLLLLNLFSDDLSTFTVYARSDRGAGLGLVRPSPYPPSTIRAWTFSIVDDHTLHPMERDSPATKIGARSSLRFPIRFDDRVIGGVSFVSFEPHAFGDADVTVGKRLSDHVASALSHFMLAERLAEQAKRTEELRAQSTSLALLDELLKTLGDSSELADVIDRISAIAGKVLAHDAVMLAVYLADGSHARRYVSSGLDVSVTPEVIEVPPSMRSSDWEYQMVDDLSVDADDGAAAMVTSGFRSALRIAIRFEDRVVGALVFLSRQLTGFTPDQVIVAKRVGERVALSLARERGVEAMRRADEANERAARLEARVRALTDELDARSGYRRVIGESASWRQVLTQAAQVAATETTVLLLGESGTGKEVVARVLHRGSERRDGPFVALNCAALPEQLLEAELFGYERGAFTGATQSKPGQLEQAGGGVLFLDEVGEMSLPAQAKFLRVLQEREFQRLGGTRVLRTDARIVAATNRDLQKAIANGQFREDLYYRLNVFAIGLPPLRDRRDDILPLTKAFLGEFGRAFAHPPAGISREARQMLLSYHWPGNVRELRNILERAAILCDGGLITDEHLALPVAVAAVRPGAPPASVPAASPLTGMPSRPAGSGGAPAEPLSRNLQSVEREMIEHALQQSRFNKSKAAKQLGLTRHQLYIRMRRHGIDD